MDQKKLLKLLQEFLEWYCNKPYWYLCYGINEFYYQIIGLENVLSCSIEAHKVKLYLKEECDNLPDDIAEKVGRVSSHPYDLWFEEGHDNRLMFLEYVIDKLKNNINNENSNNTVLH